MLNRMTKDKNSMQNCDFYRTVCWCKLPLSIPQYLPILVKTNFFLNFFCFHCSWSWLAGQPSKTMFTGKYHASHATRDDHPAHHPPLKQLSSREEFLVPIWSCCLHAQHRALFYHKRRALLNAIAQLLPACRGSRHQQNVARGRLTSLLHIAIKTNNHPHIPGSRPPCCPLSRHRGASEQQQQVQEQQKQQSQPSCETEQTEQPVWSQWCHKERCQRRQRDRGLSWL